MREKYLWKSDIFSKDVTRWSVYLLKTLLFSRCFSNILPVEINYLLPMELNYTYKSYNLTLQLMPINFTTYGYWDIYWDKVFVSFKDRFMTEGGPSLIFCTVKNLDQNPNSHLFKVSEKNTGLIWAKCSKLTAVSLEYY